MMAVRGPRDPDAIAVEQQQAAARRVAEAQALQEQRAKANAAQNAGERHGASPPPPTGSPTAGADAASAAVDAALAASRKAGAAIAAGAGGKKQPTGGTPVADHPLASDAPPSAFDPTTDPYATNPYLNHDPIVQVNDPYGVRKPTYGKDADGNTVMTDPGFIGQSTYSTGVLFPASTDQQTRTFVPQYGEAEKDAIVSGMSPEDLFMLHQQLVDANITPSTGDFSKDLNSGLENVLSYANQHGMSWQDAAQQLGDLAQGADAAAKAAEKASSRGRGGGSGGGGGGGGSAGAGGKEASLSVKLKQLAAEYAIPMSDSALGSWVSQFMMGSADVTTFSAYLAEQATSRFPSVAQGLARGQTVRQMLDPYLQIAGQLLGQNPDNFSLDDPKFLQILTGGKDGQPMTIDEFTRLIKANPAYGYQNSKAAIGDAKALAGQFAKMFGRSA